MLRPIIGEDGIAAHWFRIFHEKWNGRYVKIKDDENEKRKNQNQKCSPSKHPIAQLREVITESSCEDTPFTCTLINHGHIAQQEA